MMIRSTDLSAMLAQTDVSAQPPPTRGGTSGSLYPQALSAQVFANVKAALDCPHLPRLLNVEMEKSDPTQPDGGGGSGSSAAPDPSGANGWIPGVHPDLSTILDGNPRLASRPNSIDSVNPQDPDPYPGFQVPDSKDPGDPSAPPIREANPSDDPAPRLVKHKRDDD